ncbi:MAG TPA: hypothetical protein VN577_15650 [Terriglobales bacterium]|nr:hypothetical protein [Terriglobales bacterium]
MRVFRIAVLLLFAVTSTLSFALQPTLTPQQSGTTNRLQAVSVVNPNVVWVSGVGGSFAVTTDGGNTWRAGVVPGAEALQFRDVEGVSAKVAYLMSAGSGADSRIYKTVDGGQTWTLQFENTIADAFYDCFAFWTPQRGLAYSDSVAGRFPMLRTTDGTTWQDIGDNLPPAQAGEAGFAASGTCVATQGGRNAWVITGGAEHARVLATRDGGDTWNAYETPIVQGTPISGGFSIAFRDPWNGVLGGGDLADPTAFTNNFARSSDGGMTWKLGTPSPFPGAIYGLDYMNMRGLAEGSGNASGTEAVFITGPNGAAWSPDEGTTWHLLEGVTGYWAVDFGKGRVGWLVGTGGRILKVSF